ncbi:unnamed protein product [Rotaria socialis]|uniref:Uncharacterized protein n=1 Tax=Rotaria socialis TaxID=392032 RepID=A0A818HKE9_9BILA|nr:unnamed protein product [Rotaria socialis]CAF4302270.1 unnamed protein product [Rotaria socialis]
MPAHYTCEATTVCTNFQSAICLHCNRRLCVQHIINHNQIIPSSMENLASDLEFTFQQINDNYEKSRDTYNSTLTSLNKWRTQQIERVQQIYENRLHCVESQQESLSLLHQTLTEQLDRDARQELKLIESQKNAIAEKLSNIHQTISKVHQDGLQLKWVVSSLPPEVNLDPSFGHPKPLPVSRCTSASNIHESSRKRKRSASVSSEDFISLRKYRSFRRLVEMFSNTLDIEESKLRIANYLALQGSSFQLPTLISSYLAAWHGKSDSKEKNIVLNEYLFTIIKHTMCRHTGYIILLGIYAFFFNEKFQGNKREAMTFLLQFFVNHECISQKQILHWYNNVQLHTCMDFDGARLLIEPYIKTIWSNNTVTNPETVPVNRNMVKLSNPVEIKKEPSETAEIKQESICI